MEAWSTMASLWVPMATLETLPSPFPESFTVNWGRKPQWWTQIPEENTGTNRVIDVFRYSALSKLVGVTAYALRFLIHLRKHGPGNEGPPSAKERHLAFQEWWIADEIANLTSQSQSHLPLERQLRLFLDSDGLLRCAGKIHNALLDDSAKFPFLLPPKHPLSKLIIHDVHIKHSKCTSPDLLDYVDSSACKKTFQVLRDMPKARGGSL